MRSIQLQFYFPLNETQEKVFYHAKQGKRLRILGRRYRCVSFRLELTDIGKRILETCSRNNAVCVDANNRMLIIDLIEFTETP